MGELLQRELRRQAVGQPAGQRYLLHAPGVAGADRTVQANLQQRQAPQRASALPFSGLRAACSGGSHACRPGSHACRRNQTAGTTNGGKSERVNMPQVYTDMKTIESGY